MQANRLRRAFTLMELLVVIGIIAILVAITMVVGHHVVDGGKQKVTRDAILSLEGILTAYCTANDGNIPPPITTIPEYSATKYFPVADAREWDNQPRVMINSIGLFLYQASKVKEADTLIQGLPARIVSNQQLESYIRTDGSPLMLKTVLDGWGHPIRYVHPAYHNLKTDAAATASPQPAVPRPMTDIITDRLPTGATFVYQIGIRRNRQETTPPNKPESNADSDGGICPGGRPYFYSAGPDGKVGYKLDPSTGQILEDYNADNVYVTFPQFPPGP